jgi:hypothetical protein
MTVPPKWRERLASVRENMPPVTGKDGGPASDVDRQYAESVFTHSTVPPEHLGMVNGIRLVPARGSGLGYYAPGSRTIDVPTSAGESLRHRSDAQSNRRILSDTMVHELGHGVDHRLNPVQFNGRGKAELGRREAVASNYAERHAWPSQGFSTYDDAIHQHEVGVARGGTGHPTIRSKFGKSGVDTYKDFRKLGLTPDDPIPSDAEVDQRLGQQWEPKLVDEATRQAYGKPTATRKPKREGFIG